VPERLAGLTEVESCHSVAGEENYILKVRVAGPGALEALLGRIRTAANVSTRTTIVLSTPFEGRAAATPAEPGRPAGGAAPLDEPA
jgi:Lrp/AsnC family leucine-responsive transcriptional regulator